MDHIAVVTDSSANIPENVARELSISIVPVIVTFGDQQYRDGIDITPSQIYRWLREGKVAGTAAPAVGEFVRVFEAAEADGAEGIVCVHMASRLSATITSARHAARLLGSVPVRVVDSGTAAMGAGLAAIEAARLAAVGGNLNEVASRAATIGSQTKLLLVVPSLKYMRRGGRLGEAAMKLATNLRIKPLLILNHGSVDLIGVTRSTSKALVRMADAVESASHTGRAHVAVFHADAPDQAENLRELIAERATCAELYVTQMTAVMGAHTGPGVTGVVFYVD
jgi:DegV family protein with EDD domain